MLIYALLSLAQFFGVDTSWADLADALVNTLTGAMVLHIILACLLFVLFVVLILHARSHAAVNKGGAPSHVSRLVVLVLLPLTLLVATVILAIDLAFAVIMRDRVSDIFDDWDEDGDDLSASLSHGASDVLFSGKRRRSTDNRCTHSNMAHGRCLRARAPRHAARVRLEHPHAQEARGQPSTV